jgi:hypothetical protein
LTTAITDLPGPARPHAARTLAAMALRSISARVGLVGSVIPLVSPFHDIKKLASWQMVRSGDALNDDRQIKRVTR